MSCKRRVAVTGAIVAVLASSLRASPQSELLQPKTYSSPSGEYELQVDPSQRDGSGPGHYRLLRKGAEVWSGERSITLCDAATTDSGMVAGYGYSEGREHVRGELHVVILSNSGEKILDEAHPLRASQRRGGHGATPDPLGRGVFAQDELDRCVVRVNDDSDEANEPWWIYRLSNGERTAVIHPVASEASVSSIAAVPLRGRPLVLAEWWLHGYPRSGARFQLLGQDLLPVWTLELPDDYASQSGEVSDRILREFVWNPGAMRRCDEPGRFELALVKAQVRATYEVVPDPSIESGWRVDEIARTPLAQSSPPSTPVETIHLDPRSSVALGHPSAAPEPAIRDVLQFEFEPDGTICFVRAEKTPRTFSIVTLDNNGAATHETRVGPIVPDEQGSLAWARLDASTWLVILSHSSVDPAANASKAWEVDTRSGALTPIEGFDCPAVKSIAATAEGFAVLAQSWYGGASLYAVIAFGPDGEQDWNVTEDYANQDTLFDPADLCVTRSGRVIVLENLKHRIQVFHPNGEPDHRVDLEAAWEQEPKYPFRIALDGAEGVVVEDPSCSPSTWRMDLDGSVRAKFALRRADGSTDVAFPHHVRIAPDGHLWSSDGKVFVRFDERGVADQVLGTAPSTETVHDVDAVHVDRLGRILVRDGDSGALHVFDASGNRIALCIPDPGDFDSTRSLGRIRAADDGGIFLEGRSKRREFIEFDAQGKRLGPVSFENMDARLVPRSREGRTPTFHEQGQRWIANDGQVVATLDRRPDGRWFRNIEELAIASDGSLAVLDTWRIRSLDDHDRALAIYSADRESQVLLDLPEAVGPRDLRFCGTWALLGSFLIRTKPFEVRQLDIPEARGEKKLSLFFSPDGREVWWIERDPLRLHRYALPD